MSADEKPKKPGWFEGMPWYFVVLACLPLVGVIGGGAVGGGIGGGCCGLVLQIARSNQPTLLKFLLVGLTYGVGVVSFVLLSTLILGFFAPH